MRVVSMGTLPGIANLAMQWSARGATIAMAMVMKHGGVQTFGATRVGDVATYNLTASSHGFDGTETI